MARIFVSIPSYRDPECYWTIKDLFEKAKNPQLISIGLCLQTNPSDDPLTIDPVKDHYGQIRILRYDASQSKGACWARNKIQTLWKNEDFYFQIDSHMRFEPEWDEKLKAMYRNCSSPKPILSTYPPEYTPPNDLKTGLFSIMHFDKFNHDDIVSFNSQAWSVVDAPPKPIRRYTCAGGFIFARSDIIKEVPYDPYIYFLGEELTYSIRAWTNGWDIFCPNGVIVYHNYTPRIRHWEDHQDWHVQNNLANERIKHLLQMKISNNHLALQEIDKYGLGKIRTLREYEKAAQIDFTHKKIYEVLMTAATVHKHL